MRRKLIVGSPQAMEREPPLDEEEDLFTDVPLLHDGNVVPFCMPIHRLRCDNAECWCNNPSYRRSQ